MFEHGWNESLAGRHGSVAEWLKPIREIECDACQDRSARFSHKHDDLFRQVADSETFQSAPTMRALLVYLWNHQGEQLSEYAIATEALGRSPDFDPKSDSTVRVHIARLRAKLKEFNEAAGPAFPLRLALPLGRARTDVDIPAATQIPRLEAPRNPPAVPVGGRPE